MHNPRYEKLCHCAAGQAVEQVAQKGGQALVLKVYRSKLVTEKTGSECQGSRDGAQLQFCTTRPWFC